MFADGGPDAPSVVDALRAHGADRAVVALPPALPVRMRSLLNTVLGRLLPKVDVAWTMMTADLGEPLLPLYKAAPILFDGDYAKGWEWAFAHYANPVKTELNDMVEEGIVPYDLIVRLFEVCDTIFPRKPPPRHEGETHDQQCERLFDELRFALRTYREE